jgi:hypothetical protein
LGEVGVNDELWKLLAGALAASNAAVMWLLIKAKRNGNGIAEESPAAARSREAAVLRITDKLEAVRRDVLAEIVKTRHDQRGELTALTIRIIEEIKDELATFTRKPRR